MICKRCKKPPRNGRLPLGICSTCVVATTREGTYEVWTDCLGVPELPGDTRPSAGGYVQERTAHEWRLQHVLRIEQHLGRRLTKGENVHHLNGIRDDNRLENLELWWRPQHAGQRVRDLIKYMAEYHAEAVAEAAENLGRR